MSKPQNIQTFAELEERKKELDLEVNVSKRELAHSLGTSKVNLNDFLLKRVALPVGGAIVGLYVVTKIFRRKKRTTQQKTVIREVQSSNPAQYHYPVPPPRDEKDEALPRYSAQSTPYQRRSKQEATSEPKKGNKFTKKDKKGLINLATIASVAKIAVPAVKMIIQSVKDHQDKQLSANTDGVPNI